MFNTFIDAYPTIIKQKYSHSTISILMSLFSVKHFNEYFNDYFEEYFRIITNNYTNEIFANNIDIYTIFNFHINFIQNVPEYIPNFNKYSKYFNKSISPNNIHDKLYRNCCVNRNTELSIDNIKAFDIHSSNLAYVIEGNIIYLCEVEKIYDKYTKKIFYIRSYSRISVVYKLQSIYSEYCRFIDNYNNLVIYEYNKDVDLKVSFKCDENINIITIQCNLAISPLIYVNTFITNTGFVYFDNFNDVMYKFKYILPDDTTMYIKEIQLPRCISIIHHWLKHAYFRPTDGPGYINAIKN